MVFNVGGVTYTRARCLLNMRRFEDGVAMGGDDDDDADADAEIEDDSDPVMIMTR